MAKRVMVYLRVSTEGQVDKYGLEAQERDIRVYCSKHEMEIVGMLIERGVSGVKEERPEFDRLLNGEFDGIDAVVVAKNDRIARDINVYYYFKMMLKKKGIELISVAEDFGEFGMMARFLEAFTLCVAEMERDNITRRTSAGRKVKAKAGGYAGGRPPFGYYVTDKRLEVDEKAAECVRLVFRLRNDGLKLKEIAEKLNLDGEYKPQRGECFTIPMIQNILKHESLYRGKLNYCGEHEGIHRAIL